MSFGGGAGYRPRVQFSYSCNAFITIVRKPHETQYNLCGDGLQRENLVRMGRVWLCVVWSVGGCLCMFRGFPFWGVLCMVRVCERGVRDGTQQGYDGYEGSFDASPFGGVGQDD